MRGWTPRFRPAEIESSQQDSLRECVCAPDVPLSTPKPTTPTPNPAGLITDKRSALWPPRPAQVTPAGETIHGTDGLAHYHRRFQSIWQAVSSVSVADLSQQGHGILTKKVQLKN